MEDFSWHGLWWIPGREDEEVAGVLRYSAGKELILELTGSFDAPSSSVFGPSEQAAPKPLDFIHGVTKGDGKSITLFRCRSGGTQFSFPGFQSSSYKPSFALIGHHYKSLEELTFSEIKISYTYLEEWLNRPFFSQEEVIVGSDDPKRQTFTLSITDFPKWQVGDLCLTFESRGKTDGDALRCLKIEASMRLKVSPAPPASLDYVLQNVEYPFRNFLSFALGAAVERQSLVVHSPAAKEVVNGKEFYHEIDIISLDRREVQESTDVSKDNMLFTYDDITETFDVIMGRWFAMGEKLAPVFNLYFFVLQSPRRFQINHFLNLAQAVELFHRICYTGKYVHNWEDSEHLNRFLSVIPVDADESFKEKMKSSLLYMNEYSLRSRLKELVAEHSNATTLFVPSPKTFAADVNDARNYYTHYNERLKKKAKTGMDLYMLTLQLRHLLECCLLSQLGIPETIVVERFKRNGRIAWLGNTLRRANG